MQAQFCFNPRMQSVGGGRIVSRPSCHSMRFGRWLPVPDCRVQARILGGMASAEYAGGVLRENDESSQSPYLRTIILTIPTENFQKVLDKMRFDMI